MPKLIDYDQANRKLGHPRACFCAECFRMALKIRKQINEEQFALRDRKKKEPRNGR